MDIASIRRRTVLIAFAGLIGTASLQPAGAVAHGDGMGRGALPPEVRGTYRLDSGEILTLTGPSGMPSYEVADRRVFLRPTGEDRFSAWDGGDEALIIERDRAGRVDRLLWQRGTEMLATGRKVDLYSEDDVTFENGDVTLSGSILLPPGTGPHPAVVIVHGAEAATRESYRLLASHFARRGVAALIYDKRGIGESGGDFRRAAFDDLAGDALAGLQLLRTLPTVAPDRVGLVGMSQGGWIIAMAAGSSDEVAFLIPISASGSSPAVQDRWLNGNIVAHRDMGRGVNLASEKAWRMLLSTRELVDSGVMPPMPDVPGFWFHALDPNLDTAPLWRSVRQPLLGVWGEFDCQVPAHDSLAAVRQALGESGHSNYTLVVLPRADHSITLVEPCAQESTGWSQLRFDYPDSYFGLLAGWVHDHPTYPLPTRRTSTPASPTPSSLGWYQAPAAGVGPLGSFLPQVAMVVGLLSVFTLLGGSWLARRVIAAIRRRPPGADGLGPASLLGASAMLLSVTSLVEVLLLGSPDGSLLIGSTPVLGLTPLFALAMGATSATLLLGAIRYIRSTVRTSAATILAAAALIVFAAWSTYWGFVPAWLIVA